MTSETINIDQVNIALERVDGHNFEKFFHAFYPSFAGEDFIPLGGTGDGGADAFQSEKIYEGRQTRCYYQASIVEDYRTKIQKTVARLNEFGRKPNTLIYVTSRRVKHIDLEETDLSNKLKLNVRIRDGNYIASNVNYSSGTRAAFLTYLQPQLEFLRTIGSTSLMPQSRFSSSPAIFVFLRQELERRQGKEGLINALADGLILWALEGTDPDQGKFLKEGEIIEKIEKAIPPAKTILRGVIPYRLAHLSKELQGSERTVRWHRKQGLYCLSYGIRKHIENENAEDEALRISVIDAFETRLADKFGEKLSLNQRHLAADLSLKAINRTFENEGIELAAFLQSKLDEATPKTLAEHIDNCLIEQNIDSGEYGLLKEAILENLRGAFYDSVLEERLFFTRLSATYTLLFCLNTEPRLVEYFQSMASDFYLYVGSDILVRTISERYLHSEDQMTINTLKIIKEAGGKLILSEQVLDEIHTHIAAADYEFRNKYQGIEPSIDRVIARNSDRILIRAYFYAKLTPPTGIAGPADWQNFIDQFCDYELLHRSEGREQIKSFLQAKFQMEFVSADEIAKLYDPYEAEQLASCLEEEKKDNRLAKNDAVMTLSVYGRREQKQESSKVSEFGYRTWWLTGESRILKHTVGIVKAHRARYMIRPEFILNFMTLTPSAAEVRRTYQNIFPSLLGIQLARRVDQNELTQVIQKVQEAQNLENARRTAVISQVSNQLKGDFTKRYDHNFNHSYGENS